MSVTTTWYVLAYPRLKTTGLRNALQLSPLCRPVTYDNTLQLTILSSLNISHPLVPWHRASPLPYFTSTNLMLKPCPIVAEIALFVWWPWSRLDDRRVGVQFLAVTRNYFLFHAIKTSAPATLSLIRERPKFIPGKMGQSTKLIIEFQLVPRLRMNGAISPFLRLLRVVVLN
jgi:hypothetical protein